MIDRPAWLSEDLKPDVDLGQDVYVMFTHHSAEHYPEAPNPSGGFLIHRKPENPNGYCLGAFRWWTPPGEANRPTWQLHSLEPMDLTPSFRCHCGFHGFIRQGRWVEA